MFNFEHEAIRLEMRFRLMSGFCVEYVYYVYSEMIVTICD